MSELWNSIANGNWYWLLVAMLLGILSHLSRAIRWRLMMKPLGYNPSLLNVFCSVMVMYLANTAIPRSGEVTRCGIVNKYEKVPFTQLLGTVFIERIIDFLMLLILLVVVLFTQFGVIIDFLDKHPDIKQNLSNLLASTKFLIILGIVGILFISAIYFYRKKLMQSALFMKFAGLAKNFIAGVKSIIEMKNRTLFIAHSIFMWTMYFLMIYISFWCFESTSHLSVLTSLTVFVMASFGMVAPAPGGLGTWHFMVIETLALYGINPTPDGNAFALAAHGSMTLFLVVSGFICLVILPIINKDKTTINKENVK